MNDGQHDQELENNDEVWTYDPRESAWEQREKLPTSRWIGYARKVYDEHLDALIRFGGVGDYSDAAWTASEDFEWSELAMEGESPGALSRHAMEFVPSIGVLVFGGVYRGQGDFNDDLWVLDTRELRWHERRSVELSVAPRTLRTYAPAEPCRGDVQPWPSRATVTPGLSQGVVAYGS